MLRIIKGAAQMLACGVLALLCLEPAHAMTIDFEPVVGTIQDGQTLVFEFDITAAGNYQAVLTDLRSPAPFQFLAVGVADASTGLLLGELSSADPQLALDFTVDPGEYLALVAGLTGTDVNIGTFGLEISNVPLPPVGILFLSALASLGFLRTRRDP